MAAAQEADAVSDQDTPTDNVILVVAESMRGRVDVAQMPVLELSAEDVAAYGAGSIEELLDALGPQTGSGRGRGAGRPVILVNGKRISSFRELRSYPPEAIEKVEVFSEEVAQSFGYSPDQRVVNMILKSSFASREIELEYGWPSAGGFSTREAEATLMRIDDGRRLNVNLGWNGSGMLTEAERGIAQTPDTIPDIVGDPDPAEFRSLVGQSDAFEATVNWSSPVTNSVDLSLNSTVEYEDSLRWQGLDTVALTDPDGNSALRSLNASDPLTVEARELDIALGAALNSTIGDWQITGTADASHANSRRRIARRADTSDLVEQAANGLLAIDGELPLLADAGVDEARTRTTSLTALVTGQSRPILLPAGEVSLTLDAGYDWQQVRSEDSRNIGTAQGFQRGEFSTGANVSLPVTSRRDDFGALLGDVTLSLSAGINELSDFGTLTDWSAGATWEPFDPLQLSVNYIARDTAPTLTQLGEAEVATPNVQVFDLTTGNTVNVTVITGGNPDLPSQSQRDWKFGANLELPILRRSSLSVEYFDNNSRNVASGFPLLTPAIEAAFPDRIIRDPGGALVSIDQRPVTFAQQSAQRVQVGLNLSGALADSSESAGRGGGQGGEPGGGMRGPRGMPGIGRDNGGRWFANLTYSYEIANEVLVAPGGPLLDQLDGDALSGELPRHSASLRAGLFYRGLGSRIDAKYTGRSLVRGLDGAGSSDLHFDDLATFDLRIFLDFNQRERLISQFPILKGTRISFDVENIFDARQAITDGSGAVPLRYQPFLVDAVGRSLEVEVRKIF